MDLKYIPEKGDIVWLDLYDEQKKKVIRSSAVVISNSIFNRNRMSLICLITSKSLRNNFEIKFDIDKTAGYIQSDRIFHIDHQARNLTFATKLDGEVVQKILRIITAIILR